jgi:hypothetical protein
MGALPATAWSIPPHHLLRQATEPGFGRGVCVEIEVAIDGPLQAP